MKRKDFLAGLLTPAGLGVSLLPLAGLMSPSPSKAAPTSGPAQGPRAGYFPDALLRTHDGRTVRFYEDLLRGDKTVLINMMYAHCTGKCPLTTGNLLEVQELLGERLGRDIHMYSITLDPEQDTAQVLREYAEARGTKPGWTYLTGAPTDIERLRRKLGFVDPDPQRDKERSNHAGVVVYGNEALDRWAACPGLSKPQDIINLIDWMKQAKLPQYQGINRPRKIGP